MPVFPQPSFAYAYDVQAQIGFLRAHRQKPDRLIPAKDPARMLLGRPTPFVGRDRELATLEATFAECVAEALAPPIREIGDFNVR